MTTQTEITQKNHHRAVRFLWSFLIGATTVSLIGNIAHAVLPYLPHVVIQIGAAAVPPLRCSPPCTASPSLCVPERRAGCTAGRSARSQPSASGHSR